MMSESQQEEPAVSVVQASPDVRPVPLPTPLVRISLRSLQAMPGYTSSPVLEDGAGIVAYDTVDGEDFLVVNAYKAGTQYRFGGGQDFKLYAFCGRELQEIVAPGSTTAEPPVPPIRLSCMLCSAANGRQWVCTHTLTSGPVCTHSSRPDGDRAPDTLRSVWIRSIRGDADSAKIAIADVANADHWDDHLDEIIRVDSRAVRDLLDLPLCSGLGLYDMVAPGLLDQLDDVIDGSDVTIRLYLAGLLLPCASAFYAGLLEAAAVTAGGKGLVAQAHALRCTVAARAPEGVPGSASKAVTRSPLFAQVADRVRGGAWDAENVQYCAHWLQHILELAVKGAHELPRALEAADAKRAEAGSGPDRDQLWRQLAVAFLPGIDDASCTDLTIFPDLVMHHFHDVLGWDVAAGNYVPTATVLRPPPADFDALVKVLRVWVLQVEAVIDALQLHPASPANCGVFLASVKASACARRQRVASVAANIPAPTSAQQRADAAAVVTSSPSPFAQYGGGGGGGGGGASWPPGGGVRLPFASVSHSVESSEGVSFPTPLVPPESGREHALLVAATAASLAAKAKTDADAAQARAAHDSAKFQAEVRAMAAAAVRADELHEVAMRCAQAESDSKIRAGAGLVAPPAPAPAPGAQPTPFVPPPGMAPPPPQPPGGMPPTTCVCSDGVTRYLNTVTGNWLSFGEPAAPVALSGGAAAGGDALPAALCAVSSSTLPVKFNVPGSLFDLPCGTLDETVASFGNDLSRVPCSVLYASVDCPSARETAPSLLSTAQTDRLVETDAAGGAGAEHIRVGFQRVALDKNMLKPSTVAAILKTPASASAFLSSFQVMLAAERRTVMPLSITAQVLDTYAAVFMSLHLHRSQQELAGWGYEAYFEPLLKKLFSDILELRSACAASKGGANAMFFRTTLLKWLKHRSSTNWCDDDSRALIQTCMQKKFDKANAAHTAAIADLTAKAAAAAKAAVAKPPPPKPYPNPICRGCSVKFGVVKVTKCYLGSCPNAALAGDFTYGKA